MSRILSTLVALITCFSLSAQSLTPTERGVLAETDSYRVEFRDGVVVSLLNKLTGEHYVDRYADAAELTKHLPAGIGTQNGEAARQDAFDMYHAPWAEHGVDRTWENQHRATAASTVSHAKIEPPPGAAAAAQVTWTGLTDGDGTVFAGETYGIDLVVDAATGDLLVTPFGSSPDPGVYGAMFTLNALMPVITVEAPIFDGIRLDKDMPEQLWQVMWANYWDYGFIALNGYQTGAIGIWAQDAELRTYKNLFHMTRDGQLSVALGAMNVPPFETQTETRPFTWRLQAFDKSWAQAAARYRAWRDEDVAIAPRPEWAKHISFVNGGVNGHEMWLNGLAEFIGEENLPHTLTFIPDVRRQGFDKNHADNGPREEFPARTQAWRDRNAKFMVYLNPVIMWGPKPETPRQELGPKLADEARTIFPFQPEGSGPVGHFDVQHLGHPGWQDWFVEWVNDYLQTYGATGIYHDEGQKTPLDSRGPINGLTTPQGRAQYMRRVLTENPDSIHGVEHMTEVNMPGASVGIGSGVHWGTAKAMRLQRIHHASPVSNALGYPHSVTWGFPHQSQLSTKGESRIYNWGHDLQERRGDLAGVHIQGTIMQFPKDYPYETWRGDMWVELRRARLFAEHGLRPVFPEDYSREVLTYFDGDDGTHFRYVEQAWGTAFIQTAADGSETMHYARLTGSSQAPLAGSIANWPVYNDQGPSGLHPDRYYALDPATPRPAVYFDAGDKGDGSFYEAAVYAGYLGADLAYMQLDARPDIGRIQPYDNSILHSAKPPYRVWVNGNLAFDRDAFPDVDWSTAETIAATYDAKGNPAVGPRVVRTWWEKVDGKGVRHREYAAGEWQINFQLPAQICVLMEKPAPGFDALAAQATLRIVPQDNDTTIFDAAASSAYLEQTENRLVVSPRGSRGMNGFLQETHLPITAPGAGVLTLTASVGDRRNESIKLIRLNGVDQQVGVEIVELPQGKRSIKRQVATLRLSLAAGESALISVISQSSAELQLDWQPAEAEAAPAEDAAPAK
jgi:hypothetical protein